MSLKDIDDRSKWESRFYPAPFGVDVAGYQEKLNRIGGFGQNGEPILKLEWGGDASEKVHVEWDPFGKPTKTQDRPRFKFLRPNPLTQIADEIPIRRWIITERGEPEQYRADDDSDIKFLEGGVLKKRIEKPRGGFYTPLVVIGDHTECPKDCCKYKMCFGKYKPPSDDELEWVEAATRYLEKKKDRFDPRKPVDAQAAAALSAKVNKEARDNTEYKQWETIEEFARDFYRTHGHRFKLDTVTGTDSSGRWFIPKTVKPKKKEDE